MEYDVAFDVIQSVGAKYGIRPDVPIESEGFFRELVAKYSEPDADFPFWLDKELPGLFRCVLERPEWLQTPEWPIFQGRPMIFIGQIHYPFGSNQIFSNDSSYYVFLDFDTGTAKTVVQVV